MWKFVRTAALLLLPFLIIDALLAGLFLYLGLEMSDTDGFMKLADEFTMRALGVLTSQGIRFYKFLGVDPKLSLKLARISSLVIALCVDVAIIWLMTKWWRFERRTYRKLVELWRNRKAAPP